MSKKVALIAGGTGLVGSRLLDMLLDDPYYEKVIAVTRSPIEDAREKLNSLVVDFQNLEKHTEELVADDVFCCLGTTIKKAGTKEQFRGVDYEYPLQLAKLTWAKGAQQFLLISALGADKNASIFYNRVKGEVENSIGQLGFKSFHIFRPALLMGPRDEPRAGEDAAKIFFKTVGFLFVGPLKKYKPIDAAKVARAMLSIAKQNIPGHNIHESGELQNY